MLCLLIGWKKQTAVTETMIWQLSWLCSTKIYTAEYKQGNKQALWNFLFSALTVISSCVNLPPMMGYNSELKAKLTYFLLLFWSGYFIAETEMKLGHPQIKTTSLSVDSTTREEITKETQKKIMKWVEMKLWHMKTIVVVPKLLLSISASFHFT